MSQYLSTFIPLKEFKVLKRPDRGRITIYGDYYQSLQEILKDEKNMQRCIKLYFFLYCCNLLNKPHVNYDIPLKVLGINKKDILAKTLKTLEEYGLLRIEKRYIDGYSYPINFYFTLPFNKISSFNRSINIDYLLSVFNNHPLSSYITSLPISVPFFGLTDSSIKDCNQNKELYYPEDLYLKQFLGRYAELKPVVPGILEGPVRVLPTFNKEEGRFYHWFHGKKENRSMYTLDGEFLLEKGDLHNAYFVYFYILSCRLLKDNRYDSELNRFKELVLSGTMYEKVMAYVNSFHPNTVFANRDKIKEQLQKYLGFMNMSLINSKACDTIQVDIDRFFKIYFPDLRNIILNYSHRYEVNKDKPTVTVHRNGKTFERKNMKRIKNLHRDIAKYEIPLIVTGICRELESKYGVKPITVHDAIYMKESDYGKVSDTEIQSILRKRVDDLSWN